MKKLIIVNSCDFNKYEHPYNEYKVASNMFYHLHSREYMRDNGIEIIPLMSFLDDSSLKYDLRDYNLCSKISKGMRQNEVADKAFDFCIEKLIEKIKTTSEYDNSVIYVIIMKAIDDILKYADIVKKKNIRIVMFQDDIYNFCLVSHGIGHYDLFKIDASLLKFKDHRLENTDLVLSHGVKFFENMKTYQEKSLFFAPPLDDTTFSMFNASNFYERKNKILVSGSVYPNYTYRYKINTQLEEKNPVALKYYERFVFQAPDDIDILKLHCYTSYMKRISQYQAAVGGLYKNPLDYVLYKIFEILTTGTLLLSDGIDELGKIGLKPFVHYLPLNDENYCNNEYLEKYINTDKGKEIATNGHNFIRDYFSNKKNLDFFIGMIRSLTSDKHTKAITDLSDIVFVDPRNIVHKGNFSYGYVLPESTKLGDNNSNPLRSTFKLYENDLELPIGHALHSEITDRGLGRYSHWGNYLYFSSSDGTDPKTNRRVYKLIDTDQNTKKNNLLIDRFIMRPEINFAYTANLPVYIENGDNNNNPTQSTFRLFENDLELSTPHCKHSDIRNLGLGRYSHWNNILYFSSSDNSNPLTNGRIYRLARDI